MTVKTKTKIYIIFHVGRFFFYPDPGSGFRSVLGLDQIRINEKKLDPDKRKTDPKHWHLDYFLNIKITALERFRVCFLNRGNVCDFRSFATDN